MSAPRFSRLAIVLPLLLATSVPASSGPYHARGSFHAGGGMIWDVTPGNELFDDGLHGDGAAGDSVHAAFVISDQLPGFHEFKVANLDWTENYPNHPSFPTSNAILYTSSSGEVVHFLLDRRARAGWQPLTNAVSCSHFAPPGTEFELIGSPPELGNWNSGVPVTLDAGVWSATRTIASPGSHEFKFRAVGTWDVCNLGVHYNMFIGENFLFTTSDPDVQVRFEFDTADGRGRALILDSVPARASSWGRLKTLYR
jgi:hypothetical protein